MTLGVGVIGTGVMGAEHVRLLREETAGAALVAVCDADAARATAVAGDAAAFTDPLALIADDGVQAVVIASPDATHAGLTLACIAAGKPVLCEKPLAPSAARFRRLPSGNPGRWRPRQKKRCAWWKQRSPQADDLSRWATCAASTRPMRQ